MSNWRRALVALALFSGCDDGVPCWDDSACKEGERCHQEDPQNPGVCVVCAELEVYYDGADNDCKDDTKDSDQDKDGDGWALSPVGVPGTDCNDVDPAVSGALPETCSDGKDNDCDGRVDEPECGDVDGPSVRILAPPSDYFAFGVIEIRVEVTDDIGIDHVDLILGREGTPAFATAYGPPYDFFVDTRAVEDGRTEIRALATDFAGKTGFDRIFLTIDNETVPAIELTPEPDPTRSYGGHLTLRFNAHDVTGIDRTEVQVGGDLGIPDGDGPYSYVVDTRALPDGPQPIKIRAIDRVGTVGELEIVVRIDNTPPSVNWAVPTQGALITPPGLHGFEVHADDASGISLIHGLGLQSGVSPLSGQFDSTGRPNGLVVFTATATDAAIVDDGLVLGNVGTATVGVVIDDGTHVVCHDTVPMTGSAFAGDTTTAQNSFETYCGAVGSNDVAVEYVVAVDLEQLDVSLIASFNSVLAIYIDYCGLASQQTCLVDNRPTVTLPRLRAGQRVVVVVDGATPNDKGPFTFSLRGRVSPGQPCDPNDTSFTCDLGTCRPAESAFECPPIRDCPDGVDNDRDGLTDEDVCTSPPVLTCPADQIVDVLSTTNLNATFTSTSAILRRTWTVESAPFGSDAVPVPPNSPNTSIHTLLSGDYVLRYTEIDDDYEATSCETRLSARSLDELRIEMLWNPSIPEDLHSSDVDLHMIHPRSPRWWDDLYDCYFGNRTPNWDDPQSILDNPRLDVDDTNGRGPENINVRTPPRNTAYRIGVHYWSDHGYGPADVYVNVYCHDTLRQRFGPVTLQTDQFWKVADVTVTGDSCQVVDLATGGSPVIITEAASRATR